MTNFSVFQRPFIHLKCPERVGKDVAYECTCDVRGGDFSNVEIQRDGAGTPLPLTACKINSCMKGLGGQGSAGLSAQFFFDIAAQHSDPL